MNWKKDSIERRFAWPFKVLEDAIKISGNLTAFENEDAVFELPFSTFEPIGNQSEINLTSLDLFSEKNWNRIIIKGECYIENYLKEIKHVLPDNCTEKNVSAAVKISGKRTRIRRSLILPIENEKAAFEFEILREEVFKAVSLSVDFVLNSDISQTGVYAYKKASVVATSVSIILNCDEPDSPPGGEIKCKWQEFPGEIENAMYFLDLGFVNGVSPVIYLNSKHKDMQPIIDYKSTRGIKAKIRDSIFAHIASDIWSELMFFAVENKEAEDQEIKTFVNKIIKTLEKRGSIFKNDFFENNDFSYLDLNTAKKYIQHFIKLAPKEVNKLKSLKILNIDESSNS